MGVIKPKNSFMRLEGQVAFLTGAAGQLGRQFSLALSEAGARVVLADLRVDLCEQWKRRLAKRGWESLALELDVTRPESVGAAFRAVRKEWGRLDILVNNAGIGVFTAFETRPLEEFMRVLTVNVGGTFLCTQAAVRLMKARRLSGRIINIGSIYGVVSGDPRIYTDCVRNTSEVYAASKAAIIQMTRYWAVHLARYNIRVNCISPGGVFNRHAPGFVKNYSYRTPMGRMAREDELNGALLYLASSASDYVTGHNLIVDGGWTVW